MSAKVSRRNTSTSDYGSLTSGSGDTASSRSISSAFSRLKYHDLNPVSSYYKPLMRTFGKRFDSPKVSFIFYSI